MIRMTQKIEGLRKFTSPYAPGVSLLGARLKHNSERVFSQPIYVFGKGENLIQAHNSLYGEAAERDALYLRIADKDRSILNAELAALRQVPEKMCCYLECQMI